MPNRPIVKTLSGTSIQHPNMIPSSRNLGSRTAANNKVMFSTAYLQSKKSDSATSLMQKTTKTINTNSNSKDKLADLDLPSLPTPKRKTYPPVNKVILPDPKKWGKESETTNEDPLANELSSLTIQSNVKGKKGKGKQKQLLFHIGI